MVSKNGDDGTDQTFRPAPVKNVCSTLPTVPKGSPGTHNKETASVTARSLGSGLKSSPHHPSAGRNEKAMGAIEGTDEGVNKIADGIFSFPDVASLMKCAKNKKLPVAMPRNLEEYLIKYMGDNPRTPREHNETQNSKPYLETKQLASMALNDFSAKDRGVKDAVIRSINDHGGENLKLASDHLKDDKEVVMAAVKSNGLALEYASDRLKNDRDVVLAAVSADEK